MKIIIIVMSILSLTSLIYAMDNDERADGDGRTLGDLINVNQAEIHHNKLIVPINGISSLNCDGIKKEYVESFVPYIEEFEHKGSYLTTVKPTDLYGFNNLKKLSLENCFIQTLLLDENKKLFHLQHLSLASNYLKKIELNKLLDVMPKLQRLNLSRNPLEEIILDKEYEHNSLQCIDLTHTEQLDENKKTELINKIYSSTKGKKLVIGW